VSDLLDRVVEQLGGYFNQRILYEDNAAHLSIRNFEHSTRSQFSDVGVLVAETPEQLLEDGGLKGKVEFVSLVEVLIDFNENFGAENIVVTL